MNPLSISVLPSGLQLGELNAKATLGVECNLTKLHQGHNRDKFLLKDLPVGTRFPSTSPHNELWTPRNVAAALFEKMVTQPNVRFLNFFRRHEVHVEMLCQDAPKLG